jgi:CxxC motif-containing protein (DUF1111 family)
MFSMRLNTYARATTAIFVSVAVSSIAAMALTTPPPAAFEAGEDMPGGNATTTKGFTTRDAFSQFSTGIGGDGELKFKIGNALFRKLWVASPSSTDTSDGLGPLFNARGCQNCHFKDGRGRPPSANFPEDDAISMLLRLSIPPDTDEQKKLIESGRVKSIDEPVYGGQLQNLAVQGLDGEGHIHTEYRDVPVQFADGTSVTLRKPTFSVDLPMFGPLHPKTMYSARVAPPMIGLGLLEAIPEAGIRAAADPDDANKDGISGRINEVWSAAENKLSLGRFGWKAGASTIQEQAADAFAGDIGISSPLLPKPAGDCTAAQSACRNAPNGESARQDGREIGTELFQLVAFYSQNLAVPARRDPQSATVLKGKALFTASGCASCHTPNWKTGAVPGQAHLSNQTIWAYTDMLLHDMGEGLADHRPEGRADGFEWRTPPLWGLGLTQQVNDHTFFLHDGRARNAEEAILWHGGEAKTAQEAYRALSKADRDALLAFLNSL